MNGRRSGQGDSGEAGADTQADDGSGNIRVVTQVDKAPEASIEELASQDPGADGVSQMKGGKGPGPPTGFSLMPPGSW